MRVVGEQEFRANMRVKVSALWFVGAVTGPGRSGAVAAVYASHMLGIPFIPYGNPCPAHLRPLLIIDTAAETGATLRKAARRYAAADPITLAIFKEPPRVAFWYEAPKPQRYRHERTAALTPLTSLSHQEGTRVAR